MMGGADFGATRATLVVALAGNITLAMSRAAGTAFRLGDQHDQFAFARPQRRFQFRHLRAAIELVFAGRDHIAAHAVIWRAVLRGAASQHCAGKRGHSDSKPVCEVSHTGLIILFATGS